MKYLSTDLSHPVYRPDFAGMMESWGNSAPSVGMLNPSQVSGAGFSLPDVGQLSPLTMNAGAGAGVPGFMDKMLGYRGADGSQFAGWGGLALGAASGLMQGYTGLQQLGLFKDQLAQSKKQFDINFGAQQKLTNSRLEDRQRARVAANPTAYESVGAYMTKNAI